MTSDLLALTQQLPNSLGVYSINTLPALQDTHYRNTNHQNNNNYRTLIVNLDCDALPGSHWVGVSEHAGLIEIFDSFGESPPPLLQVWAARNSRQRVSNHLTIQAPLSINCGYFAFIFTLARHYCRNLTDACDLIINLNIDSD